QDHVALPARSAVRVDVISSPFGCDRFEELAQAVQAGFPHLLERFGPAADLLERRGFEAVDPLPSPGLAGDDARISQYPKVFADLRLTDTERLGDLAHRVWPGPQQFDDPQPARLAERPEDRRLHACQPNRLDIFPSRNM